MRVPSRDFLSSLPSFSPTKSPDRTEFTVPVETERGWGEVWFQFL